LRVAVVGAGGRMGGEVCRAVARDPDLELVAAVDPRFEDADLAALAGAGSSPVGTESSPIEFVSGISDLALGEIDVAVDFTVADAAVQTMRWCAQQGVHAVVGTTGIATDVLSELEEMFSSSTANCVIAANFAIGAILMMRMAEIAAPFMDDAEVIELHHDRKLDAPSGTALATARRMAQSRRVADVDEWPPDRTKTETVGGSRGAVGPDGLRIHAVRLPGLVAHQEVIFGAQGQSLTIRHDSYDRTSFMPGVLLAVKKVPGLDGLTAGLDRLLGL
jgi:4-hydroxy-tetrahydrodipicolinate reductase